MWDYTYPGAATRFFTDWITVPSAVALNPSRRLPAIAKMRLPGIIAHCRYPLHTSLLEGINNKIKVLKRMGYGYRDDG